MRFAHDAHVIPVMGSSTCWVAVALMACPGLPGAAALGDVVAGLVDGGADGRVVELIAGDASTRLAPRSTSTDVTPATCSTSAVTAARQWSQLMPGTEYVSCSVVWLMVEILRLGSTAQMIPPGVSDVSGFPAVPGAREPARRYGAGVHSRMATETTPTRGYSATKDQLQKRLRRIEGQVRGIERMVDEDRYCIDVLTQISAVQAALDKVALGLLDEPRPPLRVAATPTVSPRSSPTS